MMTTHRSTGARAGIVTTASVVEQN